MQKPTAKTLLFDISKIIISVIPSNDLFWDTTLTIDQAEELQRKIEMVLRDTLYAASVEQDGQ